MTSVDPAGDQETGGPVLAARAALRAIIICGLAAILVGVVAIASNAEVFPRIMGGLAAVAGCVALVAGVLTWRKTHRSGD